MNSDIGKQNILFAQAWLQNNQMNVARSDLGGTSSRTLALHVDSGEVELKHYAMPS